MQNDAKIPDAPLFVCEVDDPAVGLAGWVAIHSVGSRGSCGGIRLYPDVTKQETELLARGMTYKYCICGYSLGGAKGALKMPFDIDSEKRKILLENFGRHIGPLIKSGIYQPWTDMNCSVDDLRSIYNGAGKQLRFTPSDSAYFTAVSTFSALSATAEHLRIRPEQCTVSIEGFGKVGSQLALEIDRWGGKVIAVSNRLGTVFNPNGLDVKSLCEKRLKIGETWLENLGQYDRLSCEQLFSIDSNILVPCARTQSLTAEKAMRLKCKAVVPAANEPCAPGIERKLFEKGILPLPYFVVNIGGITGSGLAASAATDEQARSVFEVEFHQMIERLLKISDKNNESPVEIASRQASRLFKVLFESPVPEKKKKGPEKSRGFPGLSPRNLKEISEGVLSRLGISAKPSARQKIQELKSTFNTRFFPENF